MIAGAHDEKRTAEQADPPTVTSLALELQEAGIQQGRAAARGDHVSANHYHGQGLLIVDRIRAMVGEKPPRPILNAAPE